MMLTEAQWEAEAYAFEAVGVATIKDMACQSRGESDIVDCQGSIIVVYGSEQSEFPPGAYRVTSEGGEWKWCWEAR